MATEKNPSNILDHDVQETPDEEQKRQRTLTEKAADQYQQTLDKYFGRLSVLKRTIDYDVEGYKSQQHDTESLYVCKHRIDRSASQYMKYSDEFMQWLIRTNTRESLEEVDKHRIVDRTLRETVDSVLMDIRKELDRMDTKSTRSRSSRHSRHSRHSRSSTASTIMEIRVKAEAAKAALGFASEEAELKKSRAIVEEEAIKADAERKRKPIRDRY